MHNKELSIYILHFSERRIVLVIHSVPRTLGQICMLQGIFRHHTGVTISTNVLRSAYVTHAMSAEEQAEGSGINMSDLATSMRHSTREQARTYDRRMVGEKVSAVVARAANEVNSVLGVKTPGPNPGVEMEMDTVDAESEYCPEVGDIVAVVEDASTEQRPVIILGKVIRVFAKEKESLLACMVTSIRK